MKNILLILLTLLSSSCIYADELNFAQISDVHYAIERKNPYQYRMIENIDKLLNDTILQINSTENLDFIFFTGDQIDFSTEYNLKNFINFTNNLKYPWYFCFGNHDVYKDGSLTRKRYLKVVTNNSHNCHTHSNYYSFSPKKGYRVIVLDSFEDKTSKPNGQIDKKQLNWLDKELKKSDNDIVIVFTHDPIVPPFKHNENNMYIYDHSMKNAHEVIQILKKYKNLIAIFSGHYHVSKIIQDNNIIHISSPSLISYPNAYRIINIYKNNDTAIFNIKTQDTNLKEIQRNAKNLIENSSAYEGLETDKNNIFTIKIN